MTTQAAQLEPKTIAEVKATNTYTICKTHAQGYLSAGNYLQNIGDGQLTSRKLFFDQVTNQAVYVFYRKRNEANKFYVIY